MKIAVFHSFLDNIGGAEIVALTIARELNADLYTTNIDSEKIIKMGFNDVLSRIKSIGKVPINSPFKQQITLLKFRNLNLGKSYDQYYITGDWAISAAKCNSPSLWYIHSPFNELWEYKKFITKELLVWWQKPLYELWVQINRKLINSYVHKNSYFVCNSINSQNRSKKYYGIDAVVVYPPVDINHYFCDHSSGYWLSVNRLTRAKRIELQLEALTLMPHEKLIIVGCYEKDTTHFESYVSKLQNLKPDNVIFLNWVGTDDLRQLYARCKGFIATSFDEDFGMALVEAMASGKPVIASNEGGHKETVVNGKTGVLIDSIDAKKIVKAISFVSSKLSASPTYFRDNCMIQASKFNKVDFIKKLKDQFII